MRVVWSPLAVQRVNEHVEYIVREKPLAAGAWVEGIFAAVERLKPFPFSGRAVEEVRREDIREVIYGRYRIIHRVEPERVVILTVRHQRQRFEEAEVEGRS